MLSVLATEQTNNTLIDCRVIGSDYTYIESNKAYLRVFKDLRKYYYIIMVGGWENSQFSI